MKSYKSPRATAQRVSPQQVLDFGEAVRALLRVNPSITVTELVRRTKAPRPLVSLVRRRWLGSTREVTR